MSEHEISEQTRETWAAEDYWPDREQSKQLLARYFDDISDAYVDTVWAELEKYIQRAGGRRDLPAQFASPMAGKYVLQGALWYESVPAYRRHRATPAEYFCIIAHGQYLNDQSKPRPKPFLPPQFIGQWVLRTPPPHVGSIWEFLPDGKFVIHGADKIQLAWLTPFLPVRWRATHSDYRTDARMELLFGSFPETGDGRDDRSISNAKVVGDELQANWPLCCSSDWNGEIRLDRLGLR